MGTGGGIATRPVAIGAVAGLAWAAGFRGFMVEVAGAESTVDWTGTFVGILLPGLRCPPSSRHPGRPGP